MGRWGDGEIGRWMGRWVEWKMGRMGGDEEKQRQASLCENDPIHRTAGIDMKHETRMVRTAPTLYPSNPFASAPSPPALYPTTLTTGLDSYVVLQGEPSL
jgi:hypothetical protein